jgi:hypothetical protein
MVTGKTGFCGWVKVIRGCEGRKSEEIEALRFFAGEFALQSHPPQVAVPSEFLHEGPIPPLCESLQSRL